MTLRVFLQVLASLAMLLATAWGGMALWYQLPMMAAGKSASIALWCILASALLITLWRLRPWIAICGYLSLFAAILTTVIAIGLGLFAVWPTWRYYRLGDDAATPHRVRYRKLA